MNDDFDELKKFCEERGFKIFFEKYIPVKDGVLFNAKLKLVVVSEGATLRCIENAIEYIKNNYKI